MKKDFRELFAWIVIGIIGAISFGGIAIIRGEQISSLWLIVACVCTQLIAYRFYGAWIALKILHIDSKHATPAVRINDGKDFIPTNKWIVFGHHFAAIAGPGPLIGPTLAAQFGYLPGTLWILVGSVLGGAVQDMIILFSSVRRNGKSLGQMIKDEIGATAGYAALIGTLTIIIVLIAVLALIVVKALMHSPWGSFTVFMTIPIAMFIGIYLSKIRIGAVLEGSVIGIVLFLLAVYGGKIVHYDATLSQFFDRDAKFLAIAIIIYGFLAATLPVWLLLAPRDYLSSFLKLGTIFLLAVAILIFRPELQMPALTQFIDGSGPVFSGKVFPFLFITIACGAISGFHSLVASGTTPKIIPLVGYGSMLLEGCVAIMAMIAASVLQPGIYFAVNSSPAALGGADPQTAVATISSWGFPITVEMMNNLAAEMGENTLFSRTGGAPSLALGMASIFSSAFGSSMLSLWYHFAIMFEAIFILTTLDAGTRVARFMLQDMLGNIYKPLGNNSSNFSAIFSSFLIVAAWGYFLYLGVIDPHGGVNILWPLFGMSNQMLAGIALSLATVIIFKSEKKKYFFITAIPLAILLTIVTSAVFEKVFSSNPKIGFFATASSLQSQLDLGTIVDPEKIILTQNMIFNQKLIAFIALGFVTILWIVVFEAMRKIILKQRGLLSFLKLLISYFNGDFAYQNYLQHYAKNHPEEKPLNKKEFFASQQKRKWTKINRCC
jgi:carbon starvation protein